MNGYEPTNKLQKAYESLFGHCLCGHSEWCCYCDGSMDLPRKAIKEAANVIGYQLYIKDYNGGVHPIPMEDV